MAQSLQYCKNVDVTVKEEKVENSFKKNPPLKHESMYIPN